MLNCMVLTFFLFSQHYFKTCVCNLNKNCIKIKHKKYQNKKKIEYQNGNFLVMMNWLTNDKVLNEPIEHYKEVG